jgi:hypothetical protein
MGGRAALEGCFIGLILFSFSRTCLTPSVRLASPLPSLEIQN